MRGQWEEVGTRHPSLFMSLVHIFKYKSGPVSWALTERQLKKLFLIDCFSSLIGEQEDVKGKLQSIETMTAAGRGLGGLTGTWGLQKHRRDAVFSLVLFSQVRKSINHCRTSCTKPHALFLLHLRHALMVHMQLDLFCLQVCALMHHTHRTLHTGLV